MRIVAYDVRSVVAMSECQSSIHWPGSTPHGMDTTPHLAISLEGSLTMCEHLSLLSAYQLSRTRKSCEKCLLLSVEVEKSDLSRSFTLPNNDILPNAKH